MLYVDSAFVKLVPLDLITSMRTKLQAKVLCVTQTSYPKSFMAPRELFPIVSTPQSTLSTTDFPFLLLQN